MSDTAAGTATALLLLGASAFFCFAEGALFSLGRHQRESIRSEGGRKAELIERLLSKPGELIVTVLFADEAVNIAYSATVATVVAGLMGSFSSEAVTAVSVAVASPALLIFGETVPKTLAVRFPGPVSKAVAEPLSLFHWFITPARRLITGFSNLFIPSGGNGGAPETAAQEFSEEDIEALVLMGREEGVVNEVESRLADRLFRLRTTSARQIMTPNVHCMTVPDTVPAARALSMIEAEGYSRVPVHSDDRSDIRGILFAKDLLLKPPSGEDTAQTYMHEPYFIPGSKDAFDLLREFRRRRLHMAVVVDEYGRFDGIVTLEDILEEIVGEIEDERSVSRKRLTPRWEGEKLVVPGSYRVDDFNGTMLFALLKFLGIEKFPAALAASVIPSGEGAGETVAGFVFGRFGHLPAEGQTLEHGNLVFTASAISGKRISEVTVTAKREEGR